MNVSQLKRILLLSCGIVEGLITAAAAILCESAKIEGCGVVLCGSTLTLKLGGGKEFA